MKKFKAVKSKGNDEKEVRLKSGNVEVFECEHCKFVEEKKEEKD